VDLEIGMMEGCSSSSSSIYATDLNHDLVHAITLVSLKILSRRVLGSLGGLGLGGLCLIHRVKAIHRMMRQR